MMLAFPTCTYVELDIHMNVKAMQFWPHLHTRPNQPSAAGGQAHSGWIRLLFVNDSLLSEAATTMHLAYHHSNTTNQWCCQHAICHITQQLSDAWGSQVSYYEPRLEFWRQLWRAVELSDIIAQVVDAR